MLGQNSLRPAGSSPGLPGYMEKSLLMLLDSPPEWAIISASDPQGAAPDDAFRAAGWVSVGLCYHRRTNPAEQAPCPATAVG